MKIGIVGSRNLQMQNIGDYLPKGVTEIVTGGAKGIDQCARQYATTSGIKLTEFLPEYTRYGRYVAPLKRNLQIIEYSDVLIAFWDGKSKGTKHVIDNAELMGKEITVHIIGNR